MADKEDKKKDFSIQTTFHAWLQVQSTIQNQNLPTALLFGNIATGKTTLGYLLKKYIDGQNDQKFTLGKKNQLQYENQINQKTLKPLTIYPKVFHVKRSGYNLIEVPSRIYQLEPKKRPIIDRLLHLVCLIYAAKKSCLLFLVDPKTTSAKFDGWKKLFHNILDSFKPQSMNPQTFKSTGFLVDKSIGDVQQKAYIARMKSLVQLVNDEPRRDQYLQFIKSFQETQNLRVLKKLTGFPNQQQVKQIQQINKFIVSKLLQIQLVKQDGTTILQDKPYLLQIKQEKGLLDDFNNILAEILKIFQSILQQILNSKQNNVNLNQFLNSKKNDIKILSGQCIDFDQKPNNFWSKKVKDIYQYHLKISEQKKGFINNVIGKCSLYMRLREVFSSEKPNYHNILSDFMKILADHGLIFGQFKQLQNIYMRLIEYSIFQNRFGTRIQNLDYQKFIIDKQIVKECIKQENLEKFKKQIQKAELTAQNAQQIGNLLDLFYPNSQQQQNSQIYKKKLFLKQIKDLTSIDTSKTKQNLTKLWSILDKYFMNKQLENNQQNKNISKSIAIKTAQLLENHKKYDLCAQIYQKTGKLFKAKTCYQKMIKELQLKSLKVPAQLIQSYIKSLRSMKLEQTALQKCYEYSQKYGQKHKQLTPKLLQIVQEILKNKGKQIQLTKSEKEIFKGQKLELIQQYITSKLFDKIKTVLEQLSQEQRIQ